MIINAGIANVIVRNSEEDYRIIQVQEWIENDDSIKGETIY